MLSRGRVLTIAIAVSIPVLGIGLAYPTFARQDPQTFVFIANGFLVLGLALAWFALRSRWPFSPPLSLHEARKNRAQVEQAIDFTRAVVGVGPEGAPYSFASFWMLSDKTIIVMYLRPRWPYLPLLIDEGWQSLDEALSTQFGQTVRLLAQGDYADSLQAKYFRLTPDSE